VSLTSVWYPPVRCPRRRRSDGGVVCPATNSDRPSGRSFPPRPRMKTRQPSEAPRPSVDLQAPINDGICDGGSLRLSTFPCYGKGVRPWHWFDEARKQRGLRPTALCPGSGQGGWGRYVRAGGIRDESSGLLAHREEECATARTGRWRGRPACQWKEGRSEHDMRDWPLGPCGQRQEHTGSWAARRGNC
jgi:hypothetical protein